MKQEIGICKDCTMSILARYKQEIYNTFFKNTFEYRIVVYCSTMKQTVGRKILSCSSYNKQEKE